MFGKGEIIMKRVIKTASAILLALAMTTPAFAAPTDTDTTTDTPIATPTAAPSTSTRFTDINSEEFAWAKSYINDMAGKGFISGYEDNTFRPDNDVTRLEALSLFARAMGSNDSANTELLEIAHDKFDSVIKEYGLKWGTDEITQTHVKFRQMLFSMCLMQQTRELWKVWERVYSHLIQPLREVKWQLCFQEL